MTADKHELEAFGTSIDIASIPAAQGPAFGETVPSGEVGDVEPEAGAGL